jgi:protein gp37
MNETGISWTDYTWGFFSGCKKVDELCKFCYAEHLSEQHRRGSEANGKTSPAFPHGFDLTIRPKKLDEPRKLLRSHGPSLIFCESMSDIGLDWLELTDEERARVNAAGYVGTDALRDAFFDTIEATPEHRYQVLTKRPEHLLRYFMQRGRMVPPSVWIGTTIGHAKSVGRLDVLRKFRAIGARVLFISAEPLLCDLAPLIDLRGIDWLIVGGESGGHATDPKHADRLLVSRMQAKARTRFKESVTFGPWWVRADRADWVRSLRDLTRKTGTAFFHKQWGGTKPTSAGRELDGRTWDELPTVPGALPVRRVDLGGAATAGLARKRLPIAP